MRTTQVLAALLSVVVATASASTQAFPTCDSGCKSCGLTCSQGCNAPLMPADCQDCLYCRRESSSCSYVELGGQDPSAHCQTCYNSCHCTIAATCYDNQPSATASASHAPAAAPKKAAGAG
ncbi:uncharacterized protein PG998_013856 [Apiospora kogelbergensis]|uniref:uncharacterized protein n=1 Tax=Apiospora kogelbergensis TaxID=1337665 RepID=UPI00312E71A8